MLLFTPPPGDCFPKVGIVCLCAGFRELLFCGRFAQSLQQKVAASKGTAAFDSGLQENEPRLLFAMEYLSWDQLSATGDNAVPGALCEPGLRVHVGSSHGGGSSSCPSGDLKSFF